MSYLAGEILFCLIMTFLVGLTTGWAVRGIQINHKLKQLENVYRINMASLETKKNGHK